jgi:hypothetical protein
MLLWPNQSVRLRLRDECFEAARQLSQADVLSSAPPAGAFAIPNGRRVVRGLLWTLTTTSWGWRTGHSEVYVIVSTQVSWRLIPGYQSFAERALGFDDHHRPYELTPDDIERRIPSP